MTMIEALMALVLLGLIAAAFLGALGTATKATLIADEQTTAESLARSQLEHVKTLNYVDGDGTQYAAAAVPPGEDYSFYSFTIDAEPLYGSDDGIQKITVTVNHYDKEVVTLEGYKVDR